MEQLSGGLNNSNIKITTNLNEHVVLRLYHLFSEKLEVEREVQTLLTNTIAVPEVLYDDFHGRTLPYPFMLLSWCNGHQLKGALRQ